MATSTGRLAGRVAIVTGANGGIGRGVADRLAAEGAHVVVNFRPDRGHDGPAAEQVAAYPARSIAVAGDVSKRADMEANVAAAVEAFGRLDIAVSNAGIERKVPFLDLTDDDWNSIIGVNLTGAFYFSRAAARQMAKQAAPDGAPKGAQSRGKIVFISSVHEDVPLPQNTPYCASKGGLRMMMRNLAVDLAPHRINVNNVAPGAIDTPINQEMLDDPKLLAAADAEIPWGRFGTPAEVAAVVAFLASDDAEYVTGSTYFVDGGMTRQVTKY